MSPAPTEPIETQVRDALRGAAPVDTGVDRGLADLQDRLVAGALPEPLAHRSRRLPSVRVLAAAAVLLLVIGIGVAIARTGDEPDEQRVGSGLSAPTGWYIPVGLGDEWQVTDAALDTVVNAGAGASGSGAAGPMRQLVWTDPDGASGDGQPAVLSLHQAPSDAPDVSDLFESTPVVDRTTGIDLGGGVTASSGPGVFAGGAAPRTETMVAWQADGTRFVLSGHGLSDEQLVDAARGVVGAEHVEDPPLAGFGLVDDQPIGDGEGVRVHVVLTNTRTGAVVGYVLGTPGADALEISEVPTVIERSGAPGPLLRTEVPSPGAAGQPSVFYLGRWPGADVTSGPDAARGTDDLGPVTDDDVQEVLTSLRPATAAEWAAFLRSGPASLRENGGDLSVASLADVVDSTRSTTDSTPPDSSSDETSGDEATTSQFEVQGSSISSGLTAADLRLAPVLEVRSCGTDPGFAGFLPDVAGTTCYRLGSSDVDGTDLHRAEASLQGDWVVDVRARDDAVDRLNELFDACYAGASSCPSQSATGRGAVAIVLDGQVISAPEVNGRGLADDAFTISAVGMTERQARDLAAAIDAG